MTPAGPIAINLEKRVSAIELRLAAVEASAGEGFGTAEFTISSTGAVSSPPLQILNGSLLGARTAPPPAAHQVDVRDGTEAKPVHIGVTAAISRTDATSRAEVNAMGPVGTDGPDGATGFRVSVLGVAACQVQVCGLVATARQEGEANGGEASPDACAIYGLAQTQKTAIGNAIGAYLETAREIVGGRALGVEIRVKNNTEESNAYVANGPSKTMGIWINPASTATGNSACAVQIGHGFVRTFDTGIGVNEGAVTGAAFRDDSEASYGVRITKPHAEAAIAIATGAGGIVIGGNKVATAGCLLEVSGKAETVNPIADFGSGANNNVYGIRIRNNSGNASLFVSAGVNNVLTGTAQGDTGIAFTAAKVFHIGAVGTTSMIRVAENKIGLFGVAPVVRAAAITEPAETLASLKTKVNEIRTALKNLGITE